MRVKRVAVENARSFLDRAELLLDGNISIIIGPNGGGKTNLLDIVVIAIRRFLQSPQYFTPQPTSENPESHTERHNDYINNMQLDKHSAGLSRRQIIEIDVEVTEGDIQNMHAIQLGATDLKPRLHNYGGNRMDLAANWEIDNIKPGDLFSFSIENSNLKSFSEKTIKDFYEYIFYFDTYNYLISKPGQPELISPVIYLPVTRTSNGIPTEVQLTNYNDPEQKRQINGTYSKQNSSLLTLAIGRLATRYRLLETDDAGNVKKRFYEDPKLVVLTKILASVGYGWEMNCVNAMTNHYDLVLSKQGVRFRAHDASSGEKEFLNYLLSICILDIRGSLIIVDEPELHLHPRWQFTLLKLFEKLAEDTGNQFLLATHSPAFVSPHSIQYISRVFSENQISRIVRLKNENLPNSKHLFNIINSQNNEKIFFADKVILVEGISDRILFESLTSRLGINPASKTIEVISVGGKGFFDSYTKLLQSCEIEFSIIADLDYIEQVGPPELRSLFRVDTNEIKKDVIENVGSIDGTSLVRAIEEAIKLGSWEASSDIWEYIKSKRRQLIPNMSDAQKELLNSSINKIREKSIYILKKGAIEQYLPSGHHQKNLDKLIAFLEKPSFHEELDGLDELELILKSTFEYC